MALDLYAKGAKVWVRHPEVVWEEAEVVERSENRLVVQPVEEGEEQAIVIKSKDDYPPLKNPDILIGENDLTSLSYLHEPAVLHNLDVRFVQQNSIYTYCGIVLVAINPYERLPIYGEDVIQVYNGQSMGSVDPHVYAVAEQAYRQMARDKLNQSVIISGESGAGKTVSAKFSMRYFAAVGGAEGDTRIEDKVLASNPVMEALGNAKTTRNDNSSRFGKYIELGFDKKNHIMGANMKTYLLEKTRVVYQAEDERNYHVFYQLCDMRDDPELEELKLLSCEEFVYTSGGQCPVVADINDKEEFRAMQNALTIVGVKPDVQRVILRILAAVLHMGNIEYKKKSRSSDDANIPADDVHFPMVASLLGVDKQQLHKWLCNRKIQTGRETMVSPLNMDTAKQARDALAKHTYSQLFNWLVNVVNRVLKSNKPQTSFIGVLDIYGFEIFKRNSFEQFCINFANEMLQQQFTQHVFKLEQEEYIAEQIKWSMIDYADNGPCIELISHPKGGIIAMLDEECKLPRGSDDNWGEKLIKTHSSCPFFKKPKVGRETFVIVHFAASVEYTTSGFMDKNKDAMNEEHLHLLRASEFALVGELFEEKKEPEPAASSLSRARSTRSGTMSAGGSGASTRKSVRGGPGGGGGGSSKRSVGSQFRESLTSLMETLNSTTPNYIRCIKPNDFKAAFEFDPNRAVEQLRACGVLETIRISSAGYPSRWSYPDFFTRYSFLVEKKKLKRDFRAGTEIIVQLLIDDEDKFQFGKNKVFFRAGQVAYLERLRSDKLTKAGIVIQKTIRAYVERKKYVKIRRMALFLQAWLRGQIARKQCQFLRETRAATRIQTCFRVYRARKSYAKARHAIQLIQRVTRGMFGRRVYRQRLRDTKAVVIQSHVRGWLKRIQFRRTMRGIVLLQCCWRRHKAKQMFKQLKAEARSFGKLKELSKGMEMKIITLQQKVNDQARENKNLDRTNAQLNEDLNKLRQSSSQQASSNQDSKAVIQQHTEEITRLREALQAAETELSNANQANERLAVSHEEEQNVLREEIGKLKTEVQELQDMPVTPASAIANTSAVAAHNAIARQNSLPAAGKALLHRNASIPEQSLSRMSSASLGRTESPAEPDELQTENGRLKAQLEEERQYHQRFVKEHNRLQQRYDNLEEEVSYMNQNPGMDESFSRVPSGASTPYRQPSPQPVQLMAVSEDLALAIAKPRFDETGPVSSGHRKSTSKEMLMESLGADTELIMRLKGRIAELETTRSSLASQVADLSQSLLTERNKNEMLQSSAAVRVDRPRSESSSSSHLSELDMGTPPASHGNVVSQTSMPNLTRMVPPSSVLVKHASTSMVDDAAKRFNKLANYLNSEVQKENEELRRQMTALRHRIVDAAMEQSSGAEYMAVQELATELNRLNRENSSLRSDLRSRTVALLSKDPTVDILELMEKDHDTAYSGQSEEHLDSVSQIAALKETNAVLQKELDLASATLDGVEEKNKHLEAEITNFDRRRSAGDSGEPVAASIDVRLQQEVTRLTSENLDLQEEVERLQARLTAHQDGRGSDVTEDIMVDMAASGHQIGRGGITASASLMSASVLRAKYAGILKYEPSDEPLLIKRLILEMKPDQMVGKLPCLPSTILFMCLRYLDDVNDERRVQSLLTSAISGIRKVVKNKPKDLEMRIFWLSNATSLLTYMKQYSGEKAFLPNDEGLVPFCLNNFDLTDYRMVLNDLCVFLYQDAISIVQAKIQHMIVGGMLEHGIPGMWPSKPSFGRSKDQSPSYTPSDILKEFNILMEHMKNHCLDQDIVDLIFKQVLSLINAFMLNNMLLRKDLCHLSRGPQIRYNLSQIEEWCYERLAHPPDAIQPLNPITQAAQLLQINKQSPADVDAIVELCHSLNPVQIQKLLTMYTPTSEFEKRVPAAVIKAVNSYFKGRLPDAGRLMMDVNNVLALSFNHKPIDRDLRDVSVPEDMNLKFVVKA